MALVSWLKSAQKTPRAYQRVTQAILIHDRHQLVGIGNGFILCVHRRHPKRYRKHEKQNGQDSSGHVASKICVRRESVNEDRICREASVRGHPIGCRGGNCLDAAKHTDELTRFVFVLHRTLLSCGLLTPRTTESSPISDPIYFTKQRGCSYNKWFWIKRRYCEIFHNHFKLVEAHFLVSEALDTNPPATTACGWCRKEEELGSAVVRIKRQRNNNASFPTR